MSTIQINGVQTQVPVGAVAYKYADPTQGARWIMDRNEACEIASEDRSLIVWAYPTEVAREVCALRPDLCSGDAVSAVLTADPTLGAREVIELLDESAHG